MFRKAIVVLITLGIILTAGYLSQKRDDIPFATLEKAYANGESEFLNISNGLRIHYRDEGPTNAETVVLVHGFSASLHTWDGWTKNLKATHRVIRMDLPGHGLSRCAQTGNVGIQQFVDAVDEVVDALDVETFSIVGSSMGGATAWNYARKHPEKLEGLVLVGASGWPATDEDQQNSPLIFKLMENEFARGLIKDLDMTSMIRSGLEDSFANPGFVTEDMVDRYAALSRAPCHRDTLLALSTEREDRPVASADTLKEITVPTLVLHGEQDNLVPVSGGRQFVDAIDGATGHFYPNVGHLPHEEIVDQSLTDLNNFLASIEQPAMGQDPATSTFALSENN